MDALRHASIAALLGLLVSAAPLVMAILYAVSPTEHRLGMMRPLSLAATFSALAGLFLGLVNGFIGVARHAGAPNATQLAAQGFGESIVPTFVAFALLTAAWLVVAIGMRRQA